MNTKFKKSIFVTAGLVAASLALAGCASTANNGMAGMNHDMGSMSGMSGMGSDSAESSTPTSSATSNYGELGDGDIMFAQMMIPHESQAIDMSTMALSNSTNTKLLAFAKKIKAEQESDVSTMTAWLESIGATSSGTQEAEHQMHGMEIAGTVTDAQLTAMSASMGTSFDKLYVKNMLAQLEGCVVMAKAVSATSNVNVAKFAADVVKKRSAEITELKALLTK